MGMVWSRQHTSVEDGLPPRLCSAFAHPQGYIDVSTVDAHTSSAVASAVRGAGASFLEAPVSGSKGPAEQGKLVFLTAGRCGAGQHARYACESRWSPGRCTVSLARVH